MTTWSSLFPQNARLVARNWYRSSATYNLVVPARVTWGRMLAVSCGGQGATVPGSGGAFARARVRLIPGETLTVFVGQVGTSGPNGDSWVNRGGLTGQTLVHADRGKGGDGSFAAGGSASSPPSFGDSIVGGQASNGSPAGQSGGDELDTFPLGFGGHRYSVETESGEHGGAGWGSITEVLGFYADSSPIVLGRPGGYGKVCVEFWIGKPPMV
jgi:hypothetical protein